MCRADPRIFPHDEREEQRCLVFADREASSGWAAMTEPRFPCPIDRGWRDYPVRGALHCPEMVPVRIALRG